MTYTVEYFLTKFESIPESEWCLHTFEDDGKHCALGHCGVRCCYTGTATTTREAKALHALFRDNLRISVTTINDGHITRFKQPTPKRRILAGLEQIKNQTI